MPSCWLAHAAPCDAAVARPTAAARRAEIRVVERGVRKTRMRWRGCAKLRSPNPNLYGLIPNP
jgi:hypothetical protein